MGEHPRGPQFRSSSELWSFKRCFFTLFRQGLIFLKSLLICLNNQFIFHRCCFFLLMNLSRSKGLHSRSLGTPPNNVPDFRTTSHSHHSDINHWEVATEDWPLPNQCLFFFLKTLFIFRERGREGERKGEKHQCVVACCMSSTGALASNPDRESNWQPFASQYGAQSTEPHQPGPQSVSFNKRHNTLNF